MDNTPFFNPWYNEEEYAKGFFDKKVLVLGASFYCNEINCENYECCALKQETNQFNHSCPELKGRNLSDEPKRNFDNEGDVAKSFKRFFELMQRFADEKGYPEPKIVSPNNFAFTNYVQHMIGGRTTTLLSDCKDEYLKAFEQTLIDLRPDVVIVWGCVVSVPIKNKTTDDNFSTFKNTLAEENHYLFHWKNFDGHDIAFFNIYHPSAPCYYTDAEWQVMLNYLRKIFG